MSRCLRGFALLSAVLIAGATAELAAQVTTGSIGGRVTNEAGAGVDAVQVTVRSAFTGATWNATTNAQGNYLVLGLEVGAGYSVSVRRIGFEPMTKSDQNVTIGQTTRVDFQLVSRVVQLEGQVIVSEIDPVITSTRTGVGTTVSDSALQRLPTLGRNFTDFVQLTPQISNSGPGLSGGGTNNRYNNIQIDGATETDLFGLGSTGQPGGQARGRSIGIDAVKQYQVLLSPYDVRYGNFAGALINAVTKSGTNEYTGSVFVNYRDQSLTRPQDYLTDFDQTQYGFSVGGPIVRDRAHFFVNTELQQQTAPASGPFVGLAGGNAPDQATVDAYNAILSSYGLPTSNGGLRTNENPLTNLFVRFDVQGLPLNSTLVLRYNHGEARDDVFSRSATSTTFQLVNNAYKFTSRKGSTVAQLRTTLSNGWYNELFAGLTTIRDRRTPYAGGVPQITTDMGVYNLVSGSERFSHGNELDQDIVEITDNLVIPMGPHRFTVGGTFSTYKARNLFAQSIFGVWSFNSDVNFTNGAAQQYIVGVPICPPSDPGCDGAVRFKSALLGLYAQDEWRVSPRLNVTLGVRYDVPSFTDKPPSNPSLLGAGTIDRNTADVPSGNGTISPRFGFNWDVSGNQTSQVRGGVGLFAGRPAYVWLGNAFQNSGMGGVALLTCNSPNAPVFSAGTIATPPDQCTNGTTAALGGEINLLSKDLKFPQNLRANLSYDREIWNGIVASAELMFTKGINTLFYQNIALPDTILGTDPHGRAMYGTAPLAAVYRTEAGGRTTILDVTNASRDFAWQFTVGVQRRWRDNWEGSLFYTRSFARDVQSLSSSTAFSQYRFGRPAGYFAQETQHRTPSLFEQPHRIVANASYNFARTGTDLSLIYIGESGQRFHYLYGGSSSGDLNGDGIGNDLIYVPTDVTNPDEIIFVTSGGNTDVAQQLAFDEFIESNPCLRKQRGRIMERHSCAEPWRGVVNLSVRQSIGALGLSNVVSPNVVERLTMQFDIFNLANFINRDWGHFRNAGFGGIFLLNYNSKEIGSMVGPTGVAARPRFTFNPSTVFTNSQNVASNYRLQLSMKYSF